MPHSPAALDILIIGAGMSGIGLACMLRRKLPHKSFLILEARADLGGTWDLFRYPGIRSDSDLYTFAFAFKPWESRKAIAGAPEILAYIREAAEENGIPQSIRFDHRVTGAEWDSASALWTVTARAAGDETVVFQARWLVGATGYFDYAQGYRPPFPNEDRFRGRFIHPQDWPADYDPSGERIAVIGSGATAVTLIPALAKKAAHVTQIQRTPSYVLPVPSEEKLANLLRGRVPDRTLHALLRWKNIRRQRYVWLLCQRYPNAMRRLIARSNRAGLPQGFPVAEHFAPPYGPWDQRLCAMPDGDYFKALKAGRTEIVTADIESFTETGISLRNGRHIEADTVVTATGLNLLLFGGAQLSLDGVPITPADRIVFKGSMLDGVPNFCFAVGYTNSSWTLKIGLLCEYLVRLLQDLDARGMDVCTPIRPPGMQGTRPLLDFGAGYVKRSLAMLPRQGSHAPWEMSFSFMEDKKALRRGPVIDPAMRLAKAPSMRADSGAAA